MCWFEYFYISFPRYPRYPQFGIIYVLHLRVRGCRCLQPNGNGRGGCKWEYLLQFSARGNDKNTFPLHFHYILILTIHKPAQPAHHLPPQGDHAAPGEAGGGKGGRRLLPCQVGAG